MHTNEQNKCFPLEVSHVFPDFSCSSARQITSKWYNLMNLLHYSVQLDLLAAMQKKNTTIETFQYIPLILLS